MKRADYVRFERAFERLYLQYCQAGMPPHLARDRAADDAWAEYECYCDEKLEERKTDLC